MRPHANGNANTQILGALIVCVGQLARATSEVLKREYLPDDERAELRLAITRSIEAAALVMDSAKPGAGDHLLKVYTGHVGPES